MGMGVLRVRLLGGPAVEGRTEQELGSRKGRALLRLLASARGRPLSADRLATRLWGDGPPANPTGQVGVLVSRLRGVLGADRIVRTDAGYALRYDWLDLDELDARVAEAAAALAGRRLGSARAAAAAALALARGPLVADEDDEDAIAERAAVEATVLRAHHLAAEAAEAAGDHGASAASAHAILARDPYDEVALRALMRAHVAVGRPASALAAYVETRHRLVEDLGVDLSPETEALHDAIVLGPSGPAVPDDARRGAGGLPGRDAAWRWLDDRLDAASAGDGAAVLVVIRGEAGIGKSALVAAWCASLSRSTVLTGRCDELGRDLPLQPLADAVTARLRTLGPTAAAEVLGVDDAAVAGLLGVAGAGGPAPEADHEQGRARLFAAIVGVVERLAGDEPAVVVVEDLHLAGESTLAWLRFAARRGRRLVLVATSRPGGPDLPGAAFLELPPLDAAAAAEILGDADAARAAELHARSGGNPLFLLALAASESGLPATVREAVGAQVRRLGDAAASLTAAAVLGAEVDLDLVAEVVGRSAPDVLADLELALAAGLLDERGDGLAFRHELVRGAIDQDAGAARRRMLHGRAAAALDTRPGADPLVIAVHARLGGDSERAVDAFVRAATEALARFDTESALTQLDTAVGLGGSEPAFAARARVRIAAQDLEGAAADASQAIALGGSSASLEVAAWVAYYRRRYDDARALADEGVDRAGSNAALRASCLAVAGRVRHGGGDLAGAVERLVEVSGAPPAVRGVGQVWLGFARVHQGRPADALTTLAPALVDADRLAHPWAGMHGRFAAAMALGHLGRPGDALAVCDDLDAAVARAGVVGGRFLGPAANVRAWLLRHTGSPEAADERNHATLAATEGPDGGPRDAAVSEFHYAALLDLADGRLLVGDTDGADALARRLAPVDRWQGTMAWHQRHRLSLLRARLALLDGDESAAAALAAAVVADAAERGAGRYEVLGRAWLALAGGEGDRQEIDEVVERLGTTASLEGWRLAAALGECFGVDAWRRLAADRAAALVAAAGPQSQPLARAVAAVLGPDAPRASSRRW